MIVGLLAAGAVLCFCGLVALGFGLPQEFSVGSTMILAGVGLLGSGIVVVALAMVATELRKLSDAMLGKRPAGQSGRQLNIPEGLFPDAPAGQAPAAGDAETNWPAEATPSGTPAETEPVAGSAAMPPQRTPFVPEPIPEPRSFEAAWPGPPGSTPAAPPANPMLQAPASAPPAPEPPAPERRSDMFRRTARASSLTGNPPAEETAARPPAGSSGHQPAPPPAAPAVTILKSGVVDGMAYTLYSDGSIEAELADGKVRFASIEALRAHLDQRGN